MTERLFSRGFAKAVIRSVHLSAFVVCNEWRRTV